LLLFGLSGVATLVVSTFEVLLALRVLQGIAFVGTLPLSTTLVGDLYTGAPGAAAQGIRASMNGVAGIAAPAIAGLLAGIAWNYPFGLFAFAFPVFVLVYLYFPESLPEGSIDRDTAVVKALLEYWTVFRKESADSRFVLLAVGGFTDLFVRQAILVFVPLYTVRIVGASVFATGIVISAYGVIRAVTSPFAGEFVSVLGRTRTLAVAIGVMGLGSAVLPFASDIVLVGVFVVVFGAGEAVFIPSLNDSMAAFASDDRRGGIIGSIQSLKNIGRAAGPAFFGLLLAAGGFAAVFLVAGVLSGLYALVVLSKFELETV
ncbi:MAG: MFS transporter, partial [Halobacteriales archaeon]|nr:MFS transporter [Halobacteriales archaeon]